MKKPAAMARIQALASSLWVPAATPMKKPRTAVKAESKLTRRATYQDIPVEMRMTKSPARRTWVWLAYWPHAPPRNHTHPVYEVSRGGSE